MKGVVETRRSGRGWIETLSRKMNEQSCRNVHGRDSLAYIPPYQGRCLDKIDKLKANQRVEFTYHDDSRPRGYASWHPTPLEQHRHAYPVL